MRKILKNSADFPKNLLALTDCPSALYVEGSLLSADQRAVAIVGTRTPSKYGKAMARKFSVVLAKAGFTLVSGLARGVDTLVHQSAIEVGGRTIAVVGNGLDIIYPPENNHLWKQIARHGAIVSEYSLGTRPLPKNFLARNRLISGLSLAVIVVEGRRRSGTLSTAAHAANQGREVFAIPGPVTSIQSEAPLYLIEQGAYVAKSPQDILDVLM